MVNIVFLDVETTGLDPDIHEPWEIGLILRDRTTTDGEVDIEHAWQVRPSLISADAGSLRFSHYYERNAARTSDLGSAWRVAHPAMLGPAPDEPYASDRRWTDTDRVADEVATLIADAVIVGANVWFDERFIARFLRDHGHAAAHDYNLVDVKAFAAGPLAMWPPWHFADLLERYDIEAVDRHTALGDARLVRDLFDRVMGTKPGAGDAWERMTRQSPPPQDLANVLAEVDKEKEADSTESALVTRARNRNKKLKELEAPTEQFPAATDDKK